MQQTDEPELHTWYTDQDGWTPPPSHEVFSSRESRIIRMVSDSVDVASCVLARQYIVHVGRGLHISVLCEVRWWVLAWGQVTNRKRHCWRFAFVKMTAVSMTRCKYEGAKLTL